MRGLYTAASVMLASLDYQAMVAKNLANANTTGYKADRVSLATFEQMLLSLQAEGEDAVGTGVGAAGAPIDLAQGPMRDTGRALDVALTGQTFLTVQAPEGPRLTRDGSLGLNALRQLVVGEGHLVLGNAGPIVLPEGEVVIAEDGTIFVDQQPVQRLALATVDDPAGLIKVGDNLFEGPSRPATAAETQVHQGFLEGSNVDIAGTMTRMMAILRTYEAAQRVLLMQSETVDSAANQVGSV